MAASSVPPNTPGPVKLHCAESITAEWTPAEQMERAKQVMQASQRMPAVGFFGSRYGERWNIDIVALPHNAVRRQLYDAYVMANALGKMVLDIAPSDLARVYGWLGTLERFVIATFKAEERNLFVLVDKFARKRRAKVPDMLTQAGRKEATQQILELLSDARKTRDVSTSETSSKINALRYALDQFGANILDYYNLMEKFLPNFLKEHMGGNSERKQSKVEKKNVDLLLNEEHGTTLVALLMQCIESRSKRSSFLHRHFKKDKAREAFKGEVKQVQATHMQLARTFDETATKYERKFSVNTFLAHYGSNVDNKEGSLQILGQVEINDDGEMMVTAPTNVGSELLTNNAEGIEEDDDDCLYVNVPNDGSADTDGRTFVAHPEAPELPEGIVYDEEVDSDGEGDSSSYEDESSVEVEELADDDDLFEAKVPVGTTNHR